MSGVKKKKRKCPWKHDNVKGLDYCVHACHCQKVYCCLGVPGDVDLDAEDNELNMEELH